MDTSQFRNQLCFRSGRLEEVIEGCFCADGKRVCAAEDLDELVSSRTEEPCQTNVEDHVSDDFVVADEVRVFFLCGEEAVDEIFFVFELGQVGHALHESLYCVAGGDGEVIKFVETC